MKKNWSGSLPRRAFIEACARFGRGSSITIGSLDSHAQASEDDRVEEKVLADLKVPPEQKKMLLDKLRDQGRDLAALQSVPLPNDVPPAFVFDPVLDRAKMPVAETAPYRGDSKTQLAPYISDAEVPADIETLAFATVLKVSDLIRRRKITSIDLTEMCLSRLKKYDPLLHCVIHLTEDRALAKAREADADIGKGNYRGLLHGIPWAAKDLLSVAGYPTTWGAGGFEHQTFAQDATVVKRLDEAGAVLVAKLTLGALAMGDKWFGGRTRNPWNLNQGSSGSSAGSASAVAAGCVPFAIGSETLGSISSPSSRCGVTGFRPTFGFVPRTGAMALSWTMDKLGPIARSVEDCAIVMQAIYGPDNEDRSVQAYPFRWDPGFDCKELRIGYFQAAFERPLSAMDEQPPKDLNAEEVKRWHEQIPTRDQAKARRECDRQYDLAAIDRMKGLGFKLKPLELPDLPLEPISSLLVVEAAAAFDELTRSGKMLY